VEEGGEEDMPGGVGALSLGMLSLFGSQLVSGISGAEMM
jgi:hypothetical protein